MNIWFEFLVRLIGFGVSFYFLLEYTLTCKVNTNTGLFLTAFVMLSIFIYFKNYTCKNISKCEYCQSTISNSKSNVLLNIL